MALTKPLLLLLLPLAAAHSPLLLARDYLDEVCKPPTTSPTDTVPPCVSIETIETLCVPNGTAPVYLAAHQQCMCSGSYFAEWPACQSCLLLHGLRSEREVAQYDGVLSAASSAFCDAATTPTATFADVFASVQSTFPVPTTGGTVSSDRAKGETAVSLYYTAAGKQGPGVVTGSAATATATTTTQRVVTTPTRSGTTGGAGGQTTGGGGAAGPGTTATRGPSGAGSASPSPSGNVAARMGPTLTGMRILCLVQACVLYVL